MMRRLGIALVLVLGCLASAMGGEAAAVQEVPRNVPVVPWTRFSIEYTVRDFGGAGPKTVEFFITEDMGRTWRKYGEDPDARSPMLIRVKGEGVYGFMTVGTDQVGNREREPLPGTRPEAVVVVDRTPPQARWISPTKDQQLGPDGLLLSWEAKDTYLQTAPVSLQYSSDNGNTWLPLKDRLPAKGEFSWAPPARLGSNLQVRMIVRDRAGNRLTLNSPHAVMMDTIPPVVRITGPKVAPRLQVELDYNASDNAGGTGLERVSLWYTTDSGQTWNSYGDDADRKSPFVFNSPVAGPVGLMLVAKDRSGNQSPMPGPGIAPPFTIYFDNESPVVRFLPGFPREVGYRGGESVSLRWSAIDANIQQNSAALYWSREPNTKGDLIAENLPVNGPYTWLVPKVDSPNTYVTITVADELGNLGEARSQAFRIKSTPMDIGITNITPLMDDDEGAIDSTSVANETHTAAFPVGVGEAPVNDTGTTPREPIAATGGDTTPVAPIVDTASTRPDETKPLEAPTAIAKAPTATPTPPSTDWASEAVDKTPTDDAGTTPVEKIPTPVERPDMPTPTLTKSVKQAAEMVAQANQLLNDGQIDQALEAAKKAVQFNPGSAEGYGILARVAFAQGNYAGAIGDAQKAISLDPREAMYWLTRGDAYISLARDHQKEIRSLMQASGPQADIARISQQRNQELDDAHAAFEQVVALRPTEKIGHERLGDIAYFRARELLGEPERSQAYRVAIGHYEQAFNLGPSGYKEAFQIGVSYYRLRELEKALRYLESAVDASVEKTPKEAYWYLAEIHEQLGHTRDAIRYWERTAEAFPEGDPYRLKAQERARALARQLGN